MIDPIKNARQYSPMKDDSDDETRAEKGVDCEDKGVENHEDQASIASPSVKSGSPRS
jgi:hypothetical protein